LPRLRAGTFGYTYPLHKDKHFGVQARTLQVLAMTGWEKGFCL
jgi:hypothetical protein